MWRVLKMCDNIFWLTCLSFTYKIFALSIVYELDGSRHSRNEFCHGKLMWKLQKRSSHLLSLPIFRLHCRIKLTIYLWTSNKMHLHDALDSSTNTYAYLVNVIHCFILAWLNWSTSTERRI